MKLKISPSPYWVYHKLLGRFGPQGWWPISGLPNDDFRFSIDKDLRPRYHPGRKIKLTENQAFEVAVGAVLTQNTTWSNAEKALTELNKADILSAKKLLTTHDSRLATLIKSSGYFKQKTKKLKIFARYIMKRGGNLLALRHNPLPRLRKELLGLWGIGPETADSMLLYVLNKPIFVIDAYTKRIGERLGWKLSKDYDQIRLFFENQMPRSSYIFQEFHALFVKLAKENCVKNEPRCPSCPLIDSCHYGQKRVSS